MSLRVLDPRQLEGTLQGRHVLALLLAFFGVIFAVNGYFLYAALTTHSGVVAAEPYRKGLAYNARIAADERQSGLAWREAISVARDGMIAVTVSDRDGAPVAGLSIAGVIGRPSTGSHDRPLRLAELGPGRYAAEIGALGEGNWIVVIEARLAAGDAEPVYRARRRIWLKP